MKHYKIGGTQYAICGRKIKIKKESDDICGVCRSMREMSEFKRLYFQVFGTNNYTHFLKEAGSIKEAIKSLTLIIST